MTELCWQKPEFIYYYSSQRHLLWRYFGLGSCFAQTHQRFANATIPANEVWFGHKAELCGFLFAYVFVSICYCMKEPHNKHWRQHVQGNQSNSQYKRVPQCLKSMKCRHQRNGTFLSRRITLGVKTVVVLKCAVGRQQI